MSAGPAASSRARVTPATLAEKKAAGEPIVMVTAYDYTSAQIAEAAGVDVVLVGDSGAMTVLGYDSTVPITVDEMLVLTSAVRRGLATPLLVERFGWHVALGTDALFALLAAALWLLIDVERPAAP